MVTDKYKTIFGVFGAITEGANEAHMILHTKTFTKQFKGKCYNYKKQGYKARDCLNPPHLRDLSGVKCFKCNRSGHYTQDCTIDGRK